ncbi:MAG: FG-GAP repeat protein [Thermoanaerobaculia bacterium]
MKPASRRNSTPTFVAKLTASDGEALDGFGWSVAISDDTIVVGAPFAKTESNSGYGAVYVFVRPPSGWASTSSFEAKLSVVDDVAYNALGLSVAIDGSTIGASAGDWGFDANVTQGSVFLFVRPSGGWASTASFNAKLTAANGLVDEFLGTFLAMSDDTVVAAAARSGAIYIFEKPPSGWVSTSTFDAQLTASNGAALDPLGPVAVSSGVVIAGAPGATVTQFEQGAAYVFLRPPTGWISTFGFDAKLTAPDGAQGDDFGGAVAIAGDTIVVGAPGATIGSVLNQGAAYIFVLHGQGWTTTSRADEKVTEPGGRFFGDSVADSGGLIAAGTPGEAIREDFTPGAVDLYGDFGLGRVIVPVAPPRTVPIRGRHALRAIAEKAPDGRTCRKINPQ